LSARKIFRDGKEALDMSAIDAIYNYYLTTYGKASQSSRYDSHKRSELRDTYNRIVKTNKESPLYKINLNNDLEKFVIDLKEEARNAKNVISSMALGDRGMEAVYDRKIAYSSDEDAVGVEYIGQDDTNGTDHFTINVDRLAGPQVTIGNYLRMNDSDFKPGSLSFDLSRPNNSYEFQLDIEDGDTDYDVQNKIVRLMNRSNVGLAASIDVNSKGESAIRIESRQTGLSDNEKYLFKIDSNSSADDIRRLGIDEITIPAENASFTLNGKAHKALSNEFTVNNEFDLTLRAAGGKDVTVGFKANADAVGDSVSKMINAFNSLINVGKSYESVNGSKRLLNEVVHAAGSMRSDLSKVGIKEDNGLLSLDRNKLSDALSGDGREETFRILNEFKNQLSKEADRASIDPMRYVNKLIVEYKNPGRTFNAPYASSIYAGMIISRAL
jgi:flagellar hook-associated protein 2